MRATDRAETAPPPPPIPSRLQALQPPFKPERQLGEPHRVYCTVARAAASARRIVVDGPPPIAAMSGAAEAAFRKWYRTQSVAAVLCTGFLVVEKPVAMGLAAELGVLALAAFTGACGWLLRCTKQELVVLLSSSTRCSAPASAWRSSRLSS